MSGCGAIGSALALGARGCQFESGHPDHFYRIISFLEALMNNVIFFAVCFFSVSYAIAQEIPASNPKASRRISEHIWAEISPLIDQESPEALQLLANVLLFSFAHARNQIEATVAFNNIILYAQKTKKAYPTTPAADYKDIDNFNHSLHNFNNRVADLIYCSNAYNVAMNIIQQPEYKSTRRIVEDLIEQTIIFVHTLTHDQKELLNTLISNNKQTLEEMINIFTMLSRTHQALLDGQFPFQAPADQQETATIELLRNVVNVIEQQQEKSSAIISNFDSFTRAIQEQCLSIFMLYYTQVYISMRNRNLLDDYGMIMFDEYGIIPHDQRTERLYDPS